MVNPKRTLLRISTFVSLLTILAIMFIFSTGFTKPADEATVVKPTVTMPDVYKKLHLKELGLSENAFNLALKGWNRLKAKGEVTKNIIAICDFTQSSTKKRLYVIDLGSGTLLFNTLVAHGKNTGEEYARSFSNKPSSYQSSLGFYATKGTYSGQHGLSLKLEGEEPGFNDKAEDRAIVLHGADYVCDNFINQYGRLGRSFGCPSVPYESHEQIINAIKDGSCLFVYFPEKNYLSSSRLLL